jgi:hypothetical protein
MKQMRFLLLLALAGIVTAADNVLTHAEQNDGWQLLFDGRTFSGWRDPMKETPAGDSWKIENGCLATRVKPRIAEDLITAGSYGDFELLFNWRVSPAGNTGVKYRIQRTVFVDQSKIQEGPNGFEGILGRELANPRSVRASLGEGVRAMEYTVGFEFQLIDDESHPDAKKDARHTTGALYSMIAPAERAAKPAGAWNESKLLVQGNRVQHWINGVKVLEGSLDSESVRAGVAKRWAPAEPVRDALLHPKPSGPIALQHHGDEVWFKNIKIRRLTPPARLRKRPNT